MDDEQKFKDVERILSEVDEALSVTDESREINELLALQLLLEITREIHNIHDINNLVTLILDSAISFANGDRAFVMLLDKEDQLRFKMGRNRRKQYLNREDFSPSEGVLERTLQKGKAIVVPDAQSDEELGKRVSVQNLQLRTVMCAPLKLKNETIGLLYVDSQRWMGRTSRAHLNVIGSLADQAALAIYNAQKFETKEE
jgi:GAF domain-containing protein